MQGRWQEIGVAGDQRRELNGRQSSQGEMMRIQLGYGRGMGTWAIQIKVRIYTQFIPGSVPSRSTVYSRKAVNKPGRIPAPAKRMP